MEAYVLAMLIELHAADGSPIEVNPRGVISMRGPRSRDTGQYFTEDAKCLINTSDGKWLTTRETCAEVARLIAEAEKQEREEP